MAMRISYDPAADAALIRLVEHSGHQRSLMCDIEFDEAAVVLIMDEKDKLVGIEVLGAKRMLPPELLDTS